MSSYERISQVINEMVTNIKHQNTSKFQKPIFLQILLNEQIKLKKTLNQTLRVNDSTIRDWWMQEMNTTARSNYYTIVGEVLVKYLNDDLEKDFLSLNQQEKQKLIQKINKEIGRV